jgi:hypothetical protein
MSPSKAALESFKAVYKKVGPLRYQMADADCVPTTVVNSLLFVTRKTVPHRLMRLIWTSSLDQPRGTGWVCSRILSDVLHAWFTMSSFDGEAKKLTLAAFRSEVKQGKDVSLRRIVTTLKTGGAVCLTTENGSHYALLHSHNQGKEFYGFDPTWLGPTKGKTALEHSDKTFGMVNIVWTCEELQNILEDENNQFIHLISPRAASAAKPC